MQSGALVIPSVIAALVAACFAWAAFLSISGAAPLFRICGTAAFVSAIVFDDLRRQRVSNAVTFPAFVLAITAVALATGPQGVLTALSGAAVALGLFFIPFACRWIGGGDVKAVMVLGALWGVQPIIGMSWWMVVVGGVLAIVMVALQPGGLRDLTRRWCKSAWYSLRLRRITYFPPSPDRAAAAALPFTIAIGLGAAGYQLWGSPWS
jgi:Flp pilus assembly protein protease CpaA